MSQIYLIYYPFLTQILPAPPTPTKHRSPDKESYRFLYVINDSARLLSLQKHLSSLHANPLLDANTQSRVTNCLPDMSFRTLLCTVRVRPPPQCVTVPQMPSTESLLMLNSL